MAIVLHEKQAFLLLQYPSCFHSLSVGFLRLAHTLWENVEVGKHDIRQVVAPYDWSQSKGCFDAAASKPLDSVVLGIKRQMISKPIWTILNHLKRKGHKAYLVGGCVRDLVLSRTPKDFDVITTAKLSQIKKQFRRTHIVGRKFPICHVTIQDTTIEVASFDTESEIVKETEDFHLSQIPCNYDQTTFLLWRSSMRRDFTINSLLYDPFSEKIYDYAGGLRDLKMSKLRTIIPAQLSFKEDCARILRGLRFASRLGMSFTNDAEAAIRNLSSSIVNLNKGRLMLEMNYIFAYGAAEPAMFLLKKFKLLDILFPLQAAYLSQHGKNSSAQRSSMLMKLFSNMDKLLGCDRPTCQSLWIALLAFHMTLINQPQRASVIWAFSSVLYYGKWRKAVDSVREESQMLHGFTPEILRDSETTSNQSLDEDVSHFACLVNDSVNMLAGRQPFSECLQKYLSSACSPPLFHIAPNSAIKVSKLFHDLVTNIKRYSIKRDSSDINYKLLARGDLEETRFVLGKVIMDTMYCQNLPIQGQDTSMENKSGGRLSRLFM